MEPETIMIRPTALDEMVRASYESKDKEIICELFGKQENPMKWIIESVHPYQFAKRSKKKISVNELFVERASISLCNEIIGDFHLHPLNIRGSYNEYDINFLEENPNMITIIAGLKTAKKESYHKNPFLISSVIHKRKGLIYRLDLKGYYKNGRIRSALMKISK